MRRSPRSFLLWALLILVPNAARPQGASGWPAPVAPLLLLPSSWWGAEVIVIDSAEIARSTAPTFSELLQARRPGVRVFRSSGVAGDGALLMLRGPTSVSGPSEPIVIVDGVRVESRQYDPVESGMVAPSRLDDILPEDIQRIEILSGAAAALYGDGAANGVIIVTTKSGGLGPLRVRGRASWDVREQRRDFPANYQRLGVSPSTGQPVADCSLVVVESGQCTPTGLAMWNPLEQASPFRVANSARGHFELGGTALGTQVSAGLTGDERRGNLPHDEGSRLGMRGKVSRALPWRFALAASGSYLRDNARLGSGLLANGLLGAAQNDANHGYRITSYGTDSMIPSQLLRHATGGVQLRWQPVWWLDAAVMTGRDRVTEHGRFDWFAQRPANYPDFFTYIENNLTTSSAHARVSYRIHHTVNAATGVGYERELLRTSAQDTAIFNGLTSLSSFSFRLRSTSFWIDQQVSVTQQLTITGAAERITSSMFGGGAGKEWFPSATIAWAPLVDRHGVSNLRLRAAFAEAAGNSASLETLPLVIIPPLSGPPPKPRMERTRHVDIGADATLGSATVSLTAFDSRSMHLWVANVAQPGGGNLGQNATMRNWGLEAQIGSPVLDLSGVRWSGSLSLAFLNNEVTRLGTPPEFFRRGATVQGKPYGGVWATTYTYADANHDGIIGTNEVQLGSFSYIGPPLPTFESAFATDVSLPFRLTLSGTVDYRTGFRVVNLTEAQRCSLRLCRGSQDPSAPLDEQAAAAAARLAGTDVAAFAQNGTFMKVRELALRWSIPAPLVKFLTADASLTLAGRNLATWTNYRGLDPEISLAPPGALPREEAFGLPLPRELVVRLDLGQR